MAFNKPLSFSSKSHLPMNNQQPDQQHFRYPPNQGSPFPHFANTPPRQFKSPLPLPPYEEQQNSQVQWSPPFSQQAGQPKQPQRPPLPQTHAHSQSPIQHLSSKHSKRKLWLILSIMALVILFASIAARPLASLMNTPPHPSKATQTRQSSQNSQSQQTQQGITQPTSQPTVLPTQSHATTWTTTHTFTGTQEKKTDPFYVGNTWKIIWTCNPNSIFGGQGTIIVNVFSSDGTFQHGAINDTCKAGHTTGSTTEQHGGNIYLDITGGGSWIVQIQELK